MTVYSFILESLLSMIFHTGFIGYANRQPSLIRIKPCYPHFNKTQSQIEYYNIIPGCTPKKYLVNLQVFSKCRISAR